MAQGIEGAPQGSSEEAKENKPGPLTRVTDGAASAESQSLDEASPALADSDPTRTEDPPEGPTSSTSAAPEVPFSSTSAPPQVPSSSTTAPPEVPASLKSAPPSAWSAEADDDGPLLYHERQEMLLCGMHALNALLQGPFFDEIELAKLAEALDRREREVLAEAGEESAEFLRFVAEESANVAVDGNFSIQVLTEALQFWGLSCTSIDSQEARLAREQPHLEQGFICHLKAHWFTIRRVRGLWFDFNSLHAAPKALSDFYLSAFLTTLKSEGWTVFVVRGTFPDPAKCADLTRQDVDRTMGLGRWYTPATAMLALLQAEEEARRNEEFVAAAQREAYGAWGHPSSFTGGSCVGGSGGGGPVAMDWSPVRGGAGRSWGAVGGWHGRDGGWDGGAATAAPLAAPALASGAFPTAPPLGIDEDPDMKAAIARSLSTAFVEETNRCLVMSSSDASEKRASEAGGDGSGGAGATTGRNQEGRSIRSVSAAAGAQGHAIAGTLAKENSQGEVSVQPQQVAAEAPSQASSAQVDLGTSPHLSTEHLRGAELAVRAGRPPPSAGCANSDCGVEPSSPLANARPWSSVHGAPSSTAAKRLDAEATGNAVGGRVEVAVLLPSGERLCRAFGREDCVAALEAFVRARVKDEKSFLLAERGPNGRALNNKDMTLGAAGVQDKTTLIVKFHQ